MSKDNLFCKDCKEFFLHDPKNMIGICRLKGINMNPDDSTPCVFYTRTDNIVDKINKINEELERIDIPTEGSYCITTEGVYKTIKDEDLSFNDVFEGFASMLEVLLNIRAILNN